MKTQYKIELMKTIALDNYEKGEIGPMQHVGDFSPMYADSLRGIIDVIDGNFCFDRNELREFEGETGRIEVQQLEGPEGHLRSESQKAQWEKGEIDLYNATYSFYVSLQLTHPADITDLKLERI